MFLILWYKRQFLACLLMFLDRDDCIHCVFFFFCTTESDSLWICCGWDFKLLNSWVTEYEQQTHQNVWNFGGLAVWGFVVSMFFSYSCRQFVLHSGFVVNLTFFLKVEVAYIIYSLLMIDHFARICYKMLLKVLK